MRNQIAAANWKMNLSKDEAYALIDDILKAEISLAGNHKAVFASPSIYLDAVNEKLKGKKNYHAAAQNVAATENGAFTGEVSASMLKGIHVCYAVIGHSERREYYQESNKMLAEKVDRCFAAGIKPIFCCGEPLHIREANTQNDFVKKQLEESLFHLSAEQLKDFVIAYEPIWAIGTGKTATSEQAQEMHKHIRAVIADKFGAAAADAVSILYGGSVKGSNAKEIFSQPDVDGGLVGGASLKADEFVDIINALK